MPDHDPYRLKLRKDLQEQLDRELCQQTEDLVRACTDRDDELKGYRAILEGYSQPNTNLPWPGACELQDTSPRELHNTVVAAVWSAVRQMPYVCLEAVKKEDTDRAPDIETWFNIKAQLADYEDASYDAIYLAGEGRFAPMFVGYDQKVTRYFSQEPSGEEDEDGDPVLEVKLIEEPEEPNIVLRAANPWDFYVYPPTAKGVQVDEGCIRACERMELNREDLMLGVLTMGYDAAKVQQMLDRGPARITRDDWEDDAERDGIEREALTDKDSSEPWECFYVVGRAPLCLDEKNESQLPEHLVHVDCAWMLCPALGIVFKQTYSPFPYGMRPWSIWNLLRRPGSIYGEGVISMGADNFEEQTAITRFGINNMNLEASPVMTVAESWLTRYSKWTVAPARMMPRQASDPVGPRPLQWDVKSQSLIMPWLQYLDSKAHRLAASESVNRALSHNAKAAAIHFEEAMQQTKFDLFLACIHVGVAQTFRLMMLLLLKHMKEEGDTAQQFGQEVVVTPNQIEKKFRYVPQASTDAISPAQRMAKGMTVAQIVKGSIRYQREAQVALQTGAPAPMDDELTHRLLVLAGERNPERFAPTNPQDQQSSALIQQGQLNGVPEVLQNLGNVPGDEGAGMLQASPFSPSNGLNGAH